jgi:hypothetical protein
MGLQWSTSDSSDSPRLIAGTTGVVIEESRPASSLTDPRFETVAHPNVPCERVVAHYLE